MRNDKNYCLYQLREIVTDESMCEKFVKYVNYFICFYCANSLLKWSRQGWKASEICGQWDGGGVSSWET